MPTPLTFDIFLDTTGPMAPCRLLTSADSSQPAVLPALVQADKLTVRLWLVVPATTIGAAATTLTHTGTIALAIKADQSDADMLALCTSFTSATVEGRTVYTGELNLNTDAMATAFTSPSIDTINAWFDVELSNGTNRQTFQNRVAIYREVYTGTQPPPEALPEWPAPADIPNKPSADGYGRIVVKDGADGLLKLSKLAFNLLSPGVVELASNTASTLSISEPTLRIGAATGSSSTTEMSIGNAACHTDMLGEFDFSGATTNSLVRYDVEQTLTAPQQAQARTNIGVVPSGGVSVTNAGDIAAETGGSFNWAAPFTVCVKTRLSSLSSLDVIFNPDTRFGTHGGVGIGRNGSDIKLVRTSIAWGTDVICPASSIPIGSDFSLIMSSDGTTVTVYLDGDTLGAVPLPSGTTAGPIAGFGYISNQRVDGLYIFNRALTADERAAVMRGEFTAAMKTACIARYEPDQVTSLGRWLDSSGNGYDLIPGAGITPLKPQPVQVRMEECLYDLGSSVAADAPAGWTLAKTGTGILTMTPPAYVKAIKPPVVTANSANGGYTVDVAVNQSTGVVTITSRNAGTPADSVLYIHLSHRE